MLHCLNKVVAYDALVNGWKDDVKVEFEKYPEDKSDYGGKKPWADKAAHDEKSENNDKEKKVVMGYEKEKI